jgi:hypothetical protein
LPLKGLSIHERNLRIAQIDKLRRSKLEAERDIRSHNPKILAYQSNPRIPRSTVAEHIPA